MELKEIKTRYTAKCAKCSRDIREGWTVYFEPQTKHVFCKPCGSLLLAKEKEQSKLSEGKDSDVELLLNELTGSVKLHGDILAEIDSKVRDIAKDVEAHDNFVRNTIKSNTKRTPASKK